MKLTATQLRRIIKEEVQNAVSQASGKSHYKASDPSDEDPITAQDIEAFADSDELAEAVEKFCAASGIGAGDVAAYQLVDGFHETIVQLIKDGAV